MTKDITKRKEEIKKKYKQSKAYYKDYYERNKEIIQAKRRARKQGLTYTPPEPEEDDLMDIMITKVFEDEEQHCELWEKWKDGSRTWLFCRPVEFEGRSGISIQWEATTPQMIQKLKAAQAEDEMEKCIEYLKNQRQEERRRWKM